MNQVLEILQKTYENEVRGFRLVMMGEKYKLVTKIEHYEYLNRLVENEKNEKLTQSSFETLAIIAYNQPITRGEIDEIRGTDSNYQIKKLLYKNMIKEVGKSELPGRPILYSVTNEFIDHLGLSSINDLPSFNFDIINDDEDNENDLYQTRYSEV